MYRKIVKGDVFKFQITYQYLNNNLITWGVGEFFS